MSDAYVYLFTRLDALTGERVLSECRATLEAIRGYGEPVMETQIVVDQSELDIQGCFYGRLVQPGNASNVLAGEIRSLLCRAESRDREALNLVESAGEARYMLQLESRELRKQMLVLQKLSGELASAVSTRLDVAAECPLSGGDVRSRLVGS